VECPLLDAVAVHRTHELRQQFDEPVAGGSGGGTEGPGAPPPYYDQYNARIPGYSYFDLTAVWHAMSNLELRAGVNNLLDKDPPLVPSGDITGNAGASNSWGLTICWDGSCLSRSRRSFSV